MTDETIGWFSNSVLLKNLEASRKMYEFLERDLEECIEYVALDPNHFDVYSFRFADLILRIGPETLRLFNLYLYDSQREENLSSEMKPKLLALQRKRERRSDTFMDYLRMVPQIKDTCVMLEALEYWIIPFETEKRKHPNKKTLIDVVFWWEDGYNALRHRVIKEFEQSATLRHALCSLAGLWTLHELIYPGWSVTELDRSKFFLISLLKDDLANKKDVKILRSI